MRYLPRFLLGAAMTALLVAAPATLQAQVPATPAIARTTATVDATPVRYRAFRPYYRSYYGPQYARPYYGQRTYYRPYYRPYVRPYAMRPYAYRQYGYGYGQPYYYSSPFAYGFGW